MSIPFRDRLKELHRIYIQPRSQVTVVKTVIGNHWGKDGKCILGSDWQKQPTPPNQAAEYSRVVRKPKQNEADE